PLVDGLVLLSFEIVEKPWSEEMMMLVEAESPSSSSALRNCARLSSAFLMPAIEVGPLMPGVMVLRLSPVLCWLPSGSRDQNTSTNGLLRALNIGSTTLVATSAMYCCCWTLADVVPGVFASPALLLSPRGTVVVGRPALVSAACISSDRGTPFLPPV